MDDPQQLIKQYNKNMFDRKAQFQKGTIDNN